MDKKTINQKEYLKKYLSSGKDKKNKKKTKKKKPNVGSKTVTIIDDDIDLKSMRPIEDGEFDIYNNTEDAPQIAGIVDERGPVDFSDKKRWKIITDDGYGDVTVTSVQRDERAVAVPETGKNGSESCNSDYSPRQKSRKDLDSDERSRKKLSSKKSRGQISGGNKNASASQDSDFSPSRKRGKNSDSDESIRKKSLSKKRQKRSSSPFRNVDGSGDSDFSPPRKPRKDSDSDELGRRKSSSKKRQRRSPSLIENVNASQDSDFSPPRRGKEASDSDLSPPRNRESHKNKRKHSKGRDNLSESFSGNKRDGRYARATSSASPSNEIRSLHSTKRNNYSREERRSGRREYERGDRSSRRDRYMGRNGRDEEASVSPERRKKSDKKRAEKDYRKDNNSSEPDLSPPREARKKRKDFDSESSLVQKKSKNYQVMTAETSGFGQAPILRDRKTGRRRDLAAEARDKAEKDEKRQELEEKYAQWGKGLKQVEDRQQKLDRDLYEMSKPLARYADDADLERELKAQEREGDPMLAYMKRKQIKEGKQEPEKPKYSGPFMPNRFGIRPGYRWDGVDRSNGYEKKWFDAQNARKAVQEEAYKWSTADM